MENENTNQGDDGLGGQEVEKRTRNGEKEQAGARLDVTMLQDPESCQWKEVAEWPIQAFV